MMHINDNIRKARKLRKLSQEEIAEKLELKRSSYAEWEKETIPRGDILFGNYTHLHAGNILKFR